MGYEEKWIHYTNMEVEYGHRGTEILTTIRHFTLNRPENQQFACTLASGGLLAPHSYSLRSLRSPTSLRRFSKGCAEKDREGQENGFNNT
jgi:hypothetical protein